MKINKVKEYNFPRKKNLDNFSMVSSKFPNLAKLSFFVRWWISQNGVLTSIGFPGEKFGYDRNDISRALGLGK